MATNRKRRTRKLRVEISENVREYLLTGERGAADMETFSLNDERLRAAWNIVRDEILPLFIDKNPGRRPFAWWKFDAPRWDREFDAWFDGTLPEPRQRLGGTGTPDYEVLANVPHFEKGIPTGFVTKFSVEYYNGRAKDIHGNIIPTDYKEGNFKGVAIDPDDPPQFESEASYLKRHNLLTEGEEKKLTETDFEPEAVSYE